MIYDSCGEIMATSGLTRNNNGQNQTLKKSNSQINVVLDSIYQIKKEINKLFTVRKLTRSKLNDQLDNLVDHRKNMMITKASLREKKNEARKINNEWSTIVENIKSKRILMRELPVTREPLLVLKKQLNKLEDHYETTDSDPRTEKKTIEKIGLLTKKVRAKEEFNIFYQWIKNAEKQIESFKSTKAGIKKQIEETSNKLSSQETEMNDFMSIATEQQKKLQEDELKITNLINEKKSMITKLEITKSEKIKLINELGLNTGQIVKDKKINIEKNREIKAQAGLDKLNNKINRNPSLTFDEFKALVQKGLI